MTTTLAPWVTPCPIFTTPFVTPCAKCSCDDTGDDKTSSLIFLLPWILFSITFLILIVLIVVYFIKLRRRSDETDGEPKPPKLQPPDMKKYVKNTHGKDKKRQYPKNTHKGTAVDRIQQYYAHDFDVHGKVYPDPGQDPEPSEDNPDTHVTEIKGDSLDSGLHRPQDEDSDLHGLY